MKFLFLGKGWDEASTRYRIHPIRKALEQQDHQTEFLSTNMSWFGKLKLLLNAPSFDVIFIQRKLFSHSFIKLLKRRARYLVFDFDDAVFVRSNGGASSKRLRDFGAVCTAADRIFAGNSYLEENAITHGAKSERVEAVPTCVLADQYNHPVTKRSKPCLVWIGSSSTRRYLELLRPALDRLSYQHPDLELKVIADFDFHLDAMKVHNIQWSQDAEAREIAECHVGIAPMLDDPWTRGKCALKVIQYMAAGLPVVTDKAGANVDVIDDGKNGFVVESEQEWIDSITKLLNDDERREHQGLAGRAKFEKAYELKSQSERVAGLLMAV